MARRKNVKRIDPRYFLEETTHRDDPDRLDEIFGFGKDAKNRKLAKKLISAWTEAGRADDGHMPDQQGFEVELTDVMGKGKISKHQHPLGSDELGLAAMYIAKSSRDQETLPEEEEGFNNVFAAARRETKKYADAADARQSDAKGRSDRTAASRSPEKFQGQLDRALKDMRGGQRTEDRLAKALNIEMIEKSANDDNWLEYSKNNLSELIPIIKQAENYLNNYESALRRIETTKGEMERYGVELPEVISKLEKEQQRLERRVVSRLRASLKKAYKNVEQVDKEAHGRAVADREERGRVGAGSRAAPSMSDADSQRGYGGLRGKMNEVDIVVGLGASPLKETTDILNNFKKFLTEG